MSSVFENAIANFLAPIKNLLGDPHVTEIMINGPHQIFIEKKGLVSKVDNKFADEQALLTAMRSIAQSVNRLIDNENPRLDAHLPDGSRICVVIPPMARTGTTVSIRKFSKDKLTLNDLIKFGSISKDAARFLDICIHLGKNIIVSGGTGSGKTTLLNVLGGRVPGNQRLLIIEDTSELNIKSSHAVYFETRKKLQEGAPPPVSIKDLVESAMRLRPDRIIVGEVRGEEALDLIQVMNTGHDGSMGTVHANSCVDACVRLETLCLSGDTKIPPEAIKKMIASALNLIVQVKRFGDGGRRVAQISEILGVDHYGRYIARDIFQWAQKGVDDKTKKLLGDVVSCNYVPSFFDEIVVNKLPFPKQKFIAPEWAKTLKKVA